MIKKILALCAVLLLASPTNALAHGEITQATPAADSKVIAAPIEVSIEFDGKLQTAKWAKITKSSNDTALRDIKDLVEKGILKAEKQSGRNANYELV